ncbi:MAG: hypothetical protein KBS45_01350, partial [Clostridiales bacterium]|nr:hypothetical protein [Candidatus Coliplasma caballi]
IMQGKLFSWEKKVSPAPVCGTRNFSFADKAAHKISTAARTRAPCFRRRRRSRSFPFSKRTYVKKIDKLLFNVYNKEKRRKKGEISCFAKIVVLKSIPTRRSA